MEHSAAGGRIHRLVGDEIVGFYTLVVAQVDYDDAPQRLGKGLARHPIPLMLLARLTVATGSQSKGLGSGLLKDAMLRTLQAADIRWHPRDGGARERRRRASLLRAVWFRRGLLYGQYADKKPVMLFDIQEQRVFAFPFKEFRAE